MEKPRIILIEDDERQIKWAKKTLKDLIKEIKIYRSYQECEEDYFRETRPPIDWCWATSLPKTSRNDIVITDLEIPCAKRGEPETKYGMRAVTNTIQLLKGIEFKVRTKGEGFVAKKDELCKEVRKIKGGALVSNYEHHIHDNPKMREIKPYLEPLELYEGLINFQCIFDFHSNKINYFADKNGNILHKEEIGCRHLTEVQKGKMINLKPYRPLVKSLLGMITNPGWSKGDESGDGISNEEYKKIVGK